MAKLCKRDRDKLVIDNMKLVGFVINKYFNFVYSKGCYEDVKQEGYLSLVIAADNFDPDLGNKFSTYAVSTIIGNIRRYLRDKDNVIRIPRELWDDSKDNDDKTEELNRLLNTASLDYDISGYKDESAEFYDIIPSIPDEYQYITEDLIESFLQTITNSRDRDIMEEYYYSSAFFEKPTQRYMYEKYDLSQPTYSRIVKKYNVKFKKFIQGGN